jgi:hypothetical protein
MDENHSHSNEQNDQNNNYDYNNSYHKNIDNNISNINNKNQNYDYNNQINYNENSNNDKINISSKYKIMENNDSNQLYISDEDENKSPESKQYTKRNSDSNNQTKNDILDTSHDVSNSFEDLEFPLDQLQNHESNTSIINNRDNNDYNNYYDNNNNFDNNELNENSLYNEDHLLNTSWNPDIGSGSLLLDDNNNINYENYEHNENINDQNDNNDYNYEYTNSTINDQQNSLKMTSILLVTLGFLT